MTTHTVPSAGSTPQAVCDNSSRMAPLTSAIGLITASLVSVCCLGSAALVAFGFSLGETGVLATTAPIISTLQPYEGLLTLVALLLIVTSTVMVYRSSVCRSDCVTVRSRSRFPWALIALAIGLLLVSYGYELLR